MDLYFGLLGGTYFLFLLHLYILVSDAHRLSIPLRAHHNGSQPGAPAPTDTSALMSDQNIMPVLTGWTWPIFIIVWPIVTVCSGLGGTLWS